MELQIAAAKTGKYANSESGDTLEMVERPHGGVSLVLADGQRSGRSAKIISNLVARKAITLLGEGARDGVAARAAHDYLRTHRRGQVSAELHIVSVDLATQTIVISRNSQCPAIVVRSQEIILLDQPSQVIGIYPNTKPVIAQLPIEPGLTLLVFTDGVWSAGARHGQPIDLLAILRSHLQEAPAPTNAQGLADAILAESTRLDKGRPDDDMSVLVIQIVPFSRADDARRLSVSFPLPAHGPSA